MKPFWKISFQAILSILFCSILAVVYPSASMASVVNYGYNGVVDNNCLVENIGSATCSVQGAFTLDSNRFGEAQATLNGSMTLSIDGAEFFTLDFFPDPYLGQLGECTEVCNSVSTTQSGLITSFIFFAVPSWTLGDIVSFTHTGWSWDGFIGGQTGIFSGASGVEFSSNLSPIPIPTALPLFISGLIGLLIFLKRRKIVEE